MMIGMVVLTLIIVIAMAMVMIAAMTFMAAMTIMVEKKHHAAPDDVAEVCEVDMAQEAPTEGKQVSQTDTEATHATAVLRNFGIKEVQAGVSPFPKDYYLLTDGSK